MLRYITEYNEEELTQLSSTTLHTNINRPSRTKGPDE